MNTISLQSVAEKILTFSVMLLFFVIGIVLLALVVMYVIDRCQTRNAIRRNFPLLGRFRHLFEYLGEFFRQYFFAMDREELPFNRAERNWVYRAAKDIKNTIAFGSTRNLEPTGSIFFVNAGFPTLDEDARHSNPKLIGPTCRSPYTPPSFFNISAMSYGSLSSPAVTALSNGAAIAGCWLNTGEGGLSPFHLAGGCDIVFQMGTAKYGVRNDKGELDEEKLKSIAAIDQVKMIEIKLSQGAKPGKGGILPAGKVSEEIAKIRGIPANHDSISPNRHTDIHDAADLMRLVNRIRDIGGKPVGFKAVLGDVDWIEEYLDLCQDDPDSAADFITVDSADGGSGAAPQPLMDFVGLPLKESLPWLCDQLEKRQLTERVRVIASGKLITPSKVAWALALGADYVNSARGFMFSLGCIQALQCNKNTCPTGITTHDPGLQRGLVPREKAQRVAYYHQNMVQSVAMIAHSCGVDAPSELQRKHVRIVTDNGLSIPLNTYYQGSQVKSVD